jgi:hypothetical protein
MIKDEITEEKLWETEEKLLVPERGHHIARITYTILGVLSVILFIGIYGWLIFIVIPK